MRLQLKPMPGRHEPGGRACLTRYLQSQAGTRVQESTKILTTSSKLTQVGGRKLTHHRITSYIQKVRAPCNLYTKEPFPQSHAGEQYPVSVRRSLSLWCKRRSWAPRRSRSVLIQMHAAQCLSFESARGLGQVRLTDRKLPQQSGGSKGCLVPCNHFSMQIDV